MRTIAALINALALIIVSVTTTLVVGYAYLYNTQPETLTQIACEIQTDTQLESTICQLSRNNL